MNGVGREGLSNYRASLNTGYIIIPDNFKGDINRFEFIQNCYRNERLSIQIENGGGVRHEVPILSHVLRDIRFPDGTITENLGNTKKSNLGSQVIFISEPYLDQPVIIGTVSKLDESNLMSEQEFRIIKSKGGNYAILSLNGLTGDINLTTIGNNGNNGNINIKLDNSDDTSVFNLEVKGLINLISTGNTVMQNNNLLIGKASDPMVLGNKAETELNTEKKALTDLINAIKNITPLPVPANAVDPTWAALQAVINTITKRADFTKIKSKKSFID